MKKLLTVMLACLVLMGNRVSASMEGQDGASQSTEQGIGQAELTLAGITAENYPRVDGSTATLPLSAAVYRLATGCTEKEADEAIVHTKTTNSYLRLINHEVDLLIVADKNEAVDAAMQEAGVELEIKPIAWDAFIFMTNEKNPVQSLTQEEIVGIYSGRITNWSQVGGEDKKIIPFQRNENAGSQTAMKSLVMKGTGMIPAEMLEIGTMEGLLEAVASYNNEANAIGYSYYYYSSLMYRTPGLRFMAVDGVVPSNQTVQDGTYPYIAGYYAAIRRDEPEGTPARRIYDWLTTASGQELAADLGYIPVDTGIEPKVIHADETAENPLPFGEEERLIVMSGEHTLTVIDREGRVTQRFENAELCDKGMFPEGEKAWIVSASDPLPVRLRTGENGSYLAGLYSLKEDGWLIEPVYPTLQLLGGDLCTDTNWETGGRFLLHLDGSVVCESDNYPIFIRTGDYVYGDGKVYDLQGTLLFTYDGSFLKQEDGYFWFGDEAGTVMRDAYGNVIWKERSGLQFLDVCGGYICWRDANQAGLITDRNLIPVLTDARFKELNPGHDLDGIGICLEAEQPDGTGRLLSVLETNDWDRRYYLCDKENRVLSEYLGQYAEVPEGSGLPRLVRNWYEDGSFFSWEKRDGRVYVAELWTGESFDAPIGDTGKLNNVDSLGPVTALYEYDAEQNTFGTLFVNGTLFRERAQGFWTFDERPDGIVSAVFVTPGSGRELDRLFFLPDGTCLNPENQGNMLYAGKDFCCVRYGSYLYIESYDGTLYTRLLYEDEEVPETELHTYWE